MPGEEFPTTISLTIEITKKVATIEITKKVASESSSSSHRTLSFVRRTNLCQRGFSEQTFETSTNESVIQFQPRVFLLFLFTSKLILFIVWRSQTMNKMSEPNKPKFGLHCKAYNATVETHKTHPYRLHDSAHQNLLSFHRFELKNLNRISRGRTEFLSHFHSPNFQTFVHRSPTGTSWSDEQNSKSDATNPNFRTPVRRIPESTFPAKSDEAHLVHTLVQRTKHKAR